MNSNIKNRRAARAYGAERGAVEEEKNMRAIMKLDCNVVGASLCEVPMPKIAPDEMLVKVHAAALCASDKDVYYPKPSFLAQNIPVPFIMGHEFCGEVMELGSSVKGFSVGDMIASDSHMPCGSCYLCNNGMRHLCMERGVLGRKKNGCFAEYIALPAVAAFKLPKGFNPEYGALLEPFGVAVHAAQNADVSGKSVLVTGLGAIGMMEIAILKNLGASKIIACSTNDEKLATAKSLGADFGINSRTEDVRAEIMKITNGNGVQRVIDMSGAVKLINLAIDCMCCQGVMVCVGITNEPLVIDDFTNRVMFRELKITGMFGRLMFETWEIIKDFIEMNRVDFSRFVGAVMPLEDFDKGVEMSKKVIGRIVFKP